MHKIQRNINDVNILVNISKSNGILLEQSFTINNNINDSISIIDIIKLISKDKYIPMFATWELLDKCNFNCPFCYIVGHSNNKIIRFAEIKKEIEVLIDKGLFYVILTGGEPFLHPDFLDIYLFLKKNGVLVEIYSNLSMLSNKIINTFKKYPPYKIEVSIYGINNESFSKVTNSNADYYDILNNINKLKQLGIPIKCKTPINKLTILEFEKIRDYCKSKNIDFYFSTKIFDAYDGTNKQNFKVRNEILYKYDALKIKSSNSKIIFNKTNEIKKCFDCGIKNYGLHINSKFELLPCSEFRISEAKFDILENGMSNALKKYRNFVNQYIGKDIIGCYGCEAYNICKMCPALSIPVRNQKEKIINFKAPQMFCESLQNEVKYLKKEKLI